MPDSANVPMNHPKIRQDVNRAAEVKTFEAFFQQPEIREIPKGEWKGDINPSPDEIVGPPLFPSCIACHEKDQPCLWEFRLFQVRMEGSHFGEPRCEGCQVGDTDCEFVWGVRKSLEKLDDKLARLVVHAGSYYRKTERRIEGNEAARNELEKAVSVTLSASEATVVENHHSAMHQQYFALDNAEPSAVRSKPKVDREALTPAARAIYDQKCSQNRARGKKYRPVALSNGSAPELTFLRDKKRAEAKQKGTGQAQGCDDAGTGGNVSTLAGKSTDVATGPPTKRVGAELAPPFSLKKARSQDTETAPKASEPVIDPFLLALGSSNVDLYRFGDEDEPVPLPYSPPPAPVSPPLPPAPRLLAGVYSERPAGAVECDILPDPGVAIDPRSPYAVWGKGQYLTRLPYIPKAENPETNALETLSAHLDELVPGVQDARGSPYADYYDATQFTSMVELGAQIRQSIAKGKFAVVERHLAVPRIELSLEALFSQLGLTEDQTFQAHDSLKRESNFSSPYADVTLKEFIDNLEHPNLIQAILDSTAAGIHHYPPLILHVDEGYVAADKLRSLFNDFPVDMWASRVWVIQHHPLFHTYVHHDASGTATWTMVASGSKFWIITIPKRERKCASLAELHKLNEELFITSNDATGGSFFPYGAESDRYCIFARAGDMIFQPPYAWHEVFTPCKSVTVGGHFYTYDTLHLTDASRHYDVTNSGLTNQHHTSSQLTIASMLVQMIAIGPRVYRRKPLTSLCRMLLLPHLYLSPLEEGDENLLKLFIGFINRKLPSRRRLTGYKFNAHAALQPVAKRALWIADVLVEALGLHYADGDHLFTPLPWTDPGEAVEITSDIIVKMNNASSKEHSVANGSKKGGMR